MAALVALVLRGTLEKENIMLIKESPNMVVSGSGPYWDAGTKAFTQVTKVLTLKLSSGIHCSMPCDTVYGTFL